MTDRADDRTALRTYARLAGFLFLFYIAVLFPGGQITGSFHVAGDVARTAANIQASETIYRAGLLLQLLGAMTAIPLGWALYGLLKGVNANLALLALLWRVAEGVLFGVVLLLLLIGVSIYTADTAAFSQEQQLALIGLLRSGRNAGWLLASVFFSVGSTLFFYLLLKSRVIPPLLAWLGLLGSPLVTLSMFGMLLVPAVVKPIEWWLWAPIGLAEIATGLLLLIRGGNFGGRNTGANR